MALFMVLLVIVGSTVILENAATQARRAREDEMMWRGKQYVRAIKLYYRKTGHYPQDLDTLEKGVANIHFLREAYPDPMNKNEEGKWRFIYTNASGAIIGSVRYATMQQMAILDLSGGIIPGPQGDQNGSDSNVTPIAQPDQSNCSTPVGGTTGSDANSGLAPANGMPGANPANLNPNSGQNPGQSVGANANLGQSQNNSQAGCPNPSQQTGMQGQPGNGLFGGNANSQNAFGVGQFNPGQSQPGQMGGAGGAFGLTPQSLQALAQMKPTGPVDSPVIGGFLVGVGSTVDAKSIKVFKHGKKYKDWEFIWNPLEDQALAMQQGINQAGMGGMAIPGGGITNPASYGAPPPQPGSTPGPPQTPSGPQ